MGLFKLENIKYDIRIIHQKEMIRLWFGKD